MNSICKRTNWSSEICKSHSMWSGCRIQLTDVTFQMTFLPKRFLANVACERFLNWNWYRNSLDKCFMAEDYVANQNNAIKSPHTAVNRQMSGLRRLASKPRSASEGTFESVLIWNVLKFQLLHNSTQTRKPTSVKSHVPAYAILPLKRFFANVACERFFNRR